MESNLVAISVKGAPVEVPSVSVGGWTVISTGRLLRIASVFDEEWLEGNAVNDPEVFIASLKTWEAKPDIFSFARKLPETKVRYPYPCEWDNVAAIPITTYSEWWEKRVSHDLRKDVKRAEKRGVVVRRAEFDDALVRGIKDLYDEAPFRQGRPFWHYGKSLEVVKRENATYLERSDFLGAFCGDELVGFMKIVYVDGVARMMQILASASHSDKRPMNALIAKGVELAAERHCSYLTYGNYTYGNKTRDSVVDFKRRNGFERIRFPRYFVPLNVRGRLAIMARLHLGVQALLPARLIYLLLYARARMRRGAPTQTELPLQSAKTAPEPQPEQVSLQP